MKLSTLLRSVLPALTFVGVLAGGTPADAASIGVNFGTASATSQLPSNVSAGVVPQTNWNNFAAQGSNLALNDNAGLNTPALITISGTVGNNAQAAAGGDEILNNGYLSGSPNGPVGVTLSNIPYANYTVIVYTLTPLSSENIAVFLGNVVRFTQPPPATTAGYVDNNPATPYTYILGTGTSPSTATPNSDYVQFTGLTASSVTLSFQAMGIPSTTGIQIIETVPEPSTWALLAAGVGLLSVGALRRRCMV